MPGLPHVLRAVELRRTVGCSTLMRCLFREPLPHAGGLRIHTQLRYGFADHLKSGPDEGQLPYQAQLYSTHAIALSATKPVVICSIRRRAVRIGAHASGSRTGLQGCGIEHLHGCPRTT